MRVEDAEPVGVAVEERLTACLNEIECPEKGADFEGAGTLAHHKRLAGDEADETFLGHDAEHALIVGEHLVGESEPVEVLERGDGSEGETVLPKAREPTVGTGEGNFYETP